MTTTQPGLFPESAEERVKRIDAEISALLFGTPGGKFAQSLNAPEKAVLREVRFHRGSAHAISIREIALKTGLGARVIKEAVRSLRLSFRVPIGGSKHSSIGGYFIAVSDEDFEIVIAQFRDQILAELKVLRAFTSERAALDMVAALRAELEAA